LILTYTAVASACMRFALSSAPADDKDFAVLT